MYLSGSKEKSVLGHAGALCPIAVRVPQQQVVFMSYACSSHVGQGPEGALRPSLRVRSLHLVYLQIEMTKLQNACAVYSYKEESKTPRSLIVSAFSFLLTHSPFYFPIHRHPSCSSCSCNVLQSGCVSTVSRSLRLFPLLVSWVARVCLHLIIYFIADRIRYVDVGL